MKTPQVSWDEVGKTVAANLVHDTKADMVKTLNVMRAQLTVSTGWVAESLRESIADLEADIADAS